MAAAIGVRITVDDCLAGGGQLAEGAGPENRIAVLHIDAGNAHRHAPDGWLPAVRYLVEELGVDINARDHNGYNALHHAGARGDHQLIIYLVEQGADIRAVSRRGQTVADLANGPVQRVSPRPATVVLLEKLGSSNSHRCLTC